MLASRGHATTCAVIGVMVFWQPGQTYGLVAESAGIDWTIQADSPRSSRRAKAPLDKGRPGRRCFDGRLGTSSA